jgi:probable blue pigment (indigoidine) exporter
MPALQNRCGISIVKHYNPSFAVGKPVTAFTALTGGLFILPPALTADGFPLMSCGATDWIGIAYLALFGTALGYFLYIYGLGHVEAGSGSMVFFLNPFLAALLAWWILGEKLNGIELAGMAVALIPLRQNDRRSHLR